MTGSAPRSAPTSCVGRSSRRCSSTTSSTLRGSVTRTASPRTSASGRSTRCGRTSPPTRSSRVGDVWRQIRAAGDAGVAVAVTDRMTLDLRRLIDRAGRWLLNNRPQPLAVGAEVNRFAAKVAELTPRMSEWLRGDDRAIVAKDSERVHGPGRIRGPGDDGRDRAVPVQPARRHRHRRHRRPGRHRGGGHVLHVDGPSRASTACSRRSRDWLATIAGIRWRAWRFATTSTARCGRCTFDVLAVGEPDETGEQKIEEWELSNSSRVARARRTLSEIKEDGEKDLATLSVAARQIRSMTRTSGTGSTG